MHTQKRTNKKNNPKSVHLNGNTHSHFHCCRITNFENGQTEQTDTSCPSQREREREEASESRGGTGRNKVSLHWTYCLACNPSTLQMKWVMQLNAYSYMLKEQNNNRRHTRIQADSGTQCRLQHEQNGSERQKN